MARPKKTSNSLTPLELDVMQALWKHGPGNVEAVQKHLRSELAYTTVQTVLTLLYQKGRLRRKLKGRAYEYSPAASRESVVGSAIKDFVRQVFSGSPEELVMSLVKSRQLDSGKLEELTRKIKAAEEKQSDE
jgi:predicted transcriptional regulator